jgi:predicted lipoprotein with Yx(FWY)xxD motif
MKNGFRSIALASIAVLLAACATSPPDPTKTVDGVLVNPAGMTLYVFDRDVGGSGKSVCNGQCATNWPPYLVTTAGASSAAFQVITRDDGNKQWAYQGKPLYTWAKDAKPGDKTGDGVANLWKVARP